MEAVRSAPGRTILVIAACLGLAACWAPRPRYGIGEKSSPFAPERIPDTRVEIEGVVVRRCPIEDRPAGGIAIELLADPAPSPSPLLATAESERDGTFLLTSPQLDRAPALRVRVLGKEVPLTGVTPSYNARVTLACTSTTSGEVVIEIAAGADARVKAEAEALRRRNRW
jgi:hypothetical protein